MKTVTRTLLTVTLGIGLLVQSALADRTPIEKVAFVLVKNAPVAKSMKANAYDKVKSTLVQQGLQNADTKSIMSFVHNDLNGGHSILGSFLNLNTDEAQRDFSKVGGIDDEHDSGMLVF